ncbi:MAG: zinc ribbon domain-containing protein [Methanomassiliicoccus sp.]|nr:zinc ribbon domain-containing protein [Methanomassiliicoccus sp.]
MTDRCPQCGGNVPQGVEACVICGNAVTGEAMAKVPPAADAEVNQTTRCQSCGAILEGKETFCGRCGFLVSAPFECRDCRTRIGLEDRYCTGCGRLVRPGKLNRSTSRPVAALLLGLVPGLFSVWGLGQMFSVSIRKGLLFFTLGIVLAIVDPFSLLATLNGQGDLAGLSIIGMVLWAALWILQAMDAYWEAGGD